MVMLVYRRVYKMWCLLLLCEQPVHTSGAMKHRMNLPCAYMVGLTSSDITKN